MIAIAQLLTLGVIGVTAIFTGVIGQEASDDVTREGHLDFEGQGAFDPHPLYDSLQAKERQLDEGEAEASPKSVQEDEFGDSVDGYTLPDSYSKAPSYADPSLLSAVMNQAEEANFRYPIQTTVPPATDLSASGSRVDPSLSQPESNEINPFSLFPPQFHELLEIPLHTYANGSSYSPHNRQDSFLVGPFISKGYANTKIQGGQKVRPPSGQDTPQVAYKPKPVFGDRSQLPVNPVRNTSPETPISTTSRPITTTREETTTRATTTRKETTRTTVNPTTSQVTADTEPPRQKIYVSPPSRSPTRPIITRRPTTPYTKPSFVPSQSSTINDQDFISPSENVYHPETSHSTLYNHETIIHEDDPSEVDTQPTIPDNLPPLRYTRRPTAEITTPRYSTTPRPTSLPTISRPTTTANPSYVSEISEATERPTLSPSLKRNPYGTRIPPSTLSTNPTVDILSPVPVEIEQPNPQKEQKSTPQPHTTSPTQSGPKEKVEVFRPSKTDPYLQPRFPTTIHPPSHPANGHEYFSRDHPEVLPPVVNTYEVSTRPSQQSEVAGRPVNINIPSSPVPSSPSLPPPPQLPGRPIPPTPPLLTGQPSFQPLPQFTSIPHQSPPSQAVSQPGFLPPPPPPGRPERPITPPSRNDRPVPVPPIHERPAPLPTRQERPVALAPPPLPPPREFLNNEIIAPFPPAPFFDTPSSFARPPPERPTHPPSFRPPTQQANVPRPRPTSNRPNRVPRPRPQNRPSAHPSIRLPFSKVHPVVTPPPLHQESPELEPGFILPAEAGNLPKRPPQHNEIRRNHVGGNAPNILPQFRPNAPQQHETFGFQGPPDRVFTTHPRPIRPDKRPVMSNRPSFLENFNFFGRTPVNRRRGETGSRSDINNPVDKVSNKQNIVDKTAGIHYQLTHGPLPKHAQKVVVIGPFKDPPPGAPIIPPPKKNMNPHIDLSLQPPPPPPPLPSRKVSPPPFLNREHLSHEPHSSNKEHFDHAADRMGTGHLYSQNFPQHPGNKVDSPVDLPMQKGDKKESPDVIYGQPFHSRPNIRGPQNRRDPPAPNTHPISQPEFKEMEEVSEEDKEAIIAGKFKFPPMSVDRYGAGDDTALPQNIIPFPVPLITPEEDSSVKWSLFGFGSPSKPESPLPHPEHLKAEPSQNQRRPLPKASALRSTPPVPSNLRNAQNQVRVAAHGSQRYNPSRYSRPASYTVPSQASDSTKLQQNHIREDEYHNTNTTFTTEPPTSSASITTTLPRKVVTFRPFPVSDVTPKFTKPRPVYRHSTTTTESSTTVTERANLTTTTARPTSSTPNPSTSQPVTPMRITEYNPYSNYRTTVNLKETEGKEEGGFQAPVISSSAYSGWQAVGAPRLPSTGPGDGLSPVVSYVKENIPDILIKSPVVTNTYKNNDDDADVVTGVISDRMGLVDGSEEDGHLVKYSSRFNVETPGIVRSYWVKPPTLA
ncbi:mucin-2-like [Palaemon carinicauda]|uniref:mucin-2-like n=1 Tax=Palaemon carinicauda TaxID=392227 RepID=UPI0035B6AA30